MTTPPLVNIPLLKYDVTTDPAVLLISEPLNPHRSKLIITVPAAPEVKCKMFSISVPVGEEANALFSVQPAASFSINNTDWDISNNVIVGHLGNRSNEEADNENYLVKHLAEDKTVNSALTVIIEGIINTMMGSPIIKITELTTAHDSDDYETRQYYLQLSKSGEPPFYLNSFIALNPSIPGHPVSTMPRLTTFQLEWQSNADSYRIFMDNATAPFYTGINKYYKFPRGLTRDTNFVIEATKDGEILYQQLSIRCLNTDFDATYIHGAGDAQIDGYATFNGPVAMQHSVYCSGSSTFKDIMLVEKLQINDTAIAVQKFTCAKGLEVVQNTILQSATINGNLTVNGHISVTGGVNRAERANIAASFIDTLEMALQQQFSAETKKILTDKLLQL